MGGAEGEEAINRKERTMKNGPWNSRGEAYMTRDGRIIPLADAQAQRLPHSREPFDDGTAYLRNGVLYPDREQADIEDPK